MRSALFSNVFGDSGDILTGFLRSVSEFPKRPAIEAGGMTLNYEQLYEKAASYAATLATCASSAVPLTGVLAYRSPIAFAGVLGSLMRGHGYVPLNRTFPIARNCAMFQRAGCASLIVDQGSESCLSELLAGAKSEIFVILPHRESVSDLQSTWRQHRFVGRRSLRPSDEWRPRAQASGDLAYVLFTSGSTGTPKGVMVTRANVSAFVAAATERYSLSADDRLSQYFDMTFDLSVFDMFMAWERGACVCCPTEAELIAPGKFINRAGLTVWFSVPSTIAIMWRLGLLKPGAYPRLRWSLFCGEALPIESAQRWAAAAPHSIVENLYGPTELTIACTAYRCPSVLTAEHGEQGTVAIGEALPGVELLVVDEQLNQVLPGQTGELVGAGSQLSNGYLNDEDRTAAAFVRIPGRSGLFYRTGDLVRRPLPGRFLTYLGRLDDQIKVHGFRVEPGEIEAALREEGGVSAAVAIGWPRTASGASGIVAFMESVHLDLRAIDEKLRRRLPAFMIPREYKLRPMLPRNSNGKIDRKALLRELECGL